MNSKCDPLDSGTTTAAPSTIGDNEAFSNMSSAPIINSSDLAERTFLMLTDENG